MNISVTSQNFGAEMTAYTSYVNRQKKGAKIEHFFMAFIIAMSLIGVLYVLNGGLPGFDAPVELINAGTPAQNFGILLTK